MRFRGTSQGRSGIAALLLLALFALAGCNDSVTWHQKMTITVETPDGEISGSSVVEVHKYEKGGWWAPPEATGAGSEYRGEAAFVNLGEGKYLFALVKGADSLIQQHLLATGGRAALPRGWENWTRMIADSDEVWTLDPSRRHFPMLVNFDDITKPETVRRVDPDDLAATFGEGFALQSVTLELTDEPVTQGRVETVLGWLTWPRDKLLSAGNGRSPLQIKIQGGLLALDRADFRRE